MNHLVGVGDLVRIEYWLGSALQFFTYGIVMVEATEAAPVIVVDSIYLPEVFVLFDTIVIPADQLGPDADGVTVAHPLTYLAPSDVFDFTAHIDVVPS